MTFRAAGRTVAGWQVVAPSGSAWTLFVLDGTLLAVDTALDSVDGALLQALQPAVR